MTSTIDLDTIHLDHGGHDNPGAGHCLLEVVSMFAKEPFTDAPKCVSPYLRSYGIRLNDRATDERRQDLKQFIPLLPGTAGDGKDETRRLIAADFIYRTTLPKWLDRAGYTAEATTLRALPPLATWDAYHAARPAVVELRDKLYKIRYGGKSRYQYFKDLIAEEIKKHKAADAAADAVADAVAVADAAADAVAVAAADAAADADADAVAVADADAVAAAVADAVAVAVAAAVAVADAVAAADADAVAVAVAVADAAADADAVAAAWWKYGTKAYWAFRDELYKRVRAVYEERYGDTVAESWQDALTLFGLLIAGETPSI